jgi:hypothetical protein
MNEYIVAVENAGTSMQYRSRREARVEAYCPTEAIRNAAAALMVEGQVNLIVVDVTLGYVFRYVGVLITRTQATATLRGERL